MTNSRVHAVGCSPIEPSLMPPSINSIQQLRRQKRQHDDDMHLC